ncbi:hypothetical protein L596_027739 [Steinernema carpocapsae]|uniref:Uncharacterized protein n=1 Tax=Steinernema carpocapsae TaxID=34508 RepID=A0A4U5LWD5_STECR|nr:hypothetical protein L596_027739 [Steinernema carpocapsae]
MDHSKACCNTQHSNASDSSRGFWSTVRRTASAVDRFSRTRSSTTSSFLDGPREAARERAAHRSDHHSRRHPGIEMGLDFNFSSVLLISEHLERDSLLRCLEWSSIYRLTKQKNAHNSAITCRDSVCLLFETHLFSEHKKDIKSDCCVRSGERSQKSQMFTCASTSKRK